MIQVTGTLTSATTGNSINVDYNGNFNISLSGTFVGTATLQRSFDRHNVANDASATWENVTDATFTAPVSKAGYEPEKNVYYRWNCTGYTSGTITYRIGVSERTL